MFGACMRSSSLNSFRDERVSEKWDLLQRAIPPLQVRPHISRGRVCVGGVCQLNSYCHYRKSREDLYPQKVISDGEEVYSAE